MNEYNLLDTLLLGCYSYTLYEYDNSSNTWYDIAIGDNFFEVLRLSHNLKKWMLINEITGNIVLAGVN